MSRIYSVIIPKWKWSMISFFLSLLYEDISIIPTYILYGLN